MRILIVSQYFHPENFRINQLAEALKAEGHEIVVLTGQPNYPSGKFFEGYGFFRPTKELINGIEVLRVPLIPRGKGRGRHLILNYLSFVFFAIFFGLPRLRGRFDVCVAWCSSPITIAIPAIVNRMIRGVPVAIWVQDLWPETFFAVTRSRSGFLQWALSSLVKSIYRHVDQIWIQSPAYRQSVLEHGGLVSQIEYVPNWAEDLYDCSAWDGVTPENLPRNSIVFAGNLGRAQGLETLLEAAAITARETSEAHWVFVGDGVLKDWLVSEVNRRGLASSVSFLPRRPPEEMPQLLKASTAVLVALGEAQVFGQTVPSKVQSCLASGRPVIASLGGEAERILKEANCGLVAPPRDPEALAKIVKEFFTLPEKEREAFGRNGHAYYKVHFQQKSVVQRIGELLQRMSRAGRGR